jgi:hypothetical protein
LFAGHVGVGLVIGRVERRVNVGVFVASALLLDFVLWLFVLGGLESVSIRPTSLPRINRRSCFRTRTVSRPHACGPRSPALLRSGYACDSGREDGAPDYSSPRPSARIGGSTRSCTGLRCRWPGETSATVGLALWNRMPAALAVEAGIAALGLYLFLRGCGLARGRPVGFAVLGVLVIAFTVVGMTVAPAPSSVRAMAVSSLTTLALVTALFVWLGKAWRFAEPSVLRSPSANKQTELR